MTIGGSIALIALGAILTYAVEFDIAGINIDVIGIILMIAGAIGLVVGLAMLSRRRTLVAGAPVTTAVVEETPVRRTTTYDQY